MMRSKKKALNNKPVPIRINPDELDSIKCSKCGGEIFIAASRIKKVSAIISPNGQESYVGIPVSVCLACQEPLPLKP